MLKQTKMEGFVDFVEGCIKVFFLLLPTAFWFAPIGVLFKQSRDWLEYGFWTDVRLIDALGFFGYTNETGLRDPTDWIGINRIFDWLLDTWFGWTSFLLGLVLFYVMYAIRHYDI